MPLFYLCLALCGVLMGMLAMFFGYSLKLSARTVKLEQKNGKELREIAKLKEEVRQLKDRQKTLGGFYSKSILKEQNNDHDQR